MSPKMVYKTLYYLRAKQDHQPVNLESIVHNARETLPHVADTEIALASDDILRIQHYQPSSQGSDGALLHIVRYVPGEKAPTLQPLVQEPEDHESVQEAPDGFEFKDGDSFLLISTNHILFASHGISLQKSELYLKKMLEKAGIDETLRSFDLRPASDLDKLALLQTSGVRSVSLGASAYQVSIPQVGRNSWMSRVFGGLADEVKALASVDETNASQKALEDMLVNVELRLDGNNRAEVAAQDLIVQIAESVLDDDDSPISEFVIHTRSGEKITPETVRLQTRVAVARQDRSVNHQSVWSGMKQYLDEIRSGNLLEQ